MSKKKKTTSGKKKSIALAKAKPKPKHAAPSERKDAARPYESGRWTVDIDPGKLAFIANGVVLYVVIKNHGPSTILATTGLRDGEKVVPNLLRVLRVDGDLTLQTMDNQNATVEMEFMPRSKY